MVETSSLCHKQLTEMNPFWTWLLMMTRYWSSPDLTIIDTEICDYIEQEKSCAWLDPEYFSAKLHQNTTELQKVCLVFLNHCWITVCEFYWLKSWFGFFDYSSKHSNIVSEVCSSLLLHTQTHPNTNLALITDVTWGEYTTWCFLFSFITFGLCGCCRTLSWWVSNAAFK